MQTFWTEQKSPRLKPSYLDELMRHSLGTVSQILVYIRHRQIHASPYDRARRCNPGSWIEFNFNKFL